MASKSHVPERRLVQLTWSLLLFGAIFSLLVGAPSDAVAAKKEANASKSKPAAAAPKSAKAAPARETAAKSAAKSDAKAGAKTAAKASGGKTTVAKAEKAAEPTAAKAKYGKGGKAVADADERRSAKGGKLAKADKADKADQTSKTSKREKEAEKLASRGDRKGKLSAREEKLAAREKDKSGKSRHAQVAEREEPKRASARRDRDADERATRTARAPEREKPTARPLALVAGSGAVVGAAALGLTKVSAAPAMNLRESPAAAVAPTTALRDLPPLPVAAARAPALPEPRESRVAARIDEVPSGQVAEQARQLIAARSARLSLRPEGGNVDSAMAPSGGARLSLSPLPSLHSGHDPLELRSNVAFVIDQDTREVLVNKNSHAVTPIASLTKLMTALVISESRVPLGDMITINEEDVDYEKGSRSRLSLGTTLSRGEMMHLALMSSENRAANALGRTFPGGMVRFVQLMNTRAMLLGMKDTRYVEPTGLSSGNQSTAEDLAVLVAAASQDPLLRMYSTSPGHEVAVGSRVLQYNNTNGLVRNPSWEIGLQKTGYISEAGRCLVMQAKVAGRKLIMVFLDSAGKNTRLGDAERVRRWVEAQRAASTVASVSGNPS